MDNTDKKKTLYDEIFTDKSSPEVINSNSNQEIKDAIANKEFKSNDIVNMEDIFVFDSKEEKKDTHENAEDDDIKMEDAKYFDLINNTLVDLRLNLENGDSSSNGLNDINLDNLIKKDNNTIATPTEKIDIKQNIIQEKDITNNSSIEINATPKKERKVLPFWVNYAFVAALIAVSIIGSLTFLAKQFMR